MVPAEFAESREPATTSPALSIGAVFGGTHQVDSFWERPITDLQRAVVYARERVTSPLRVNVVFHVEGERTPNGFVGVRTGRFTKSGPVLMIQAAVPSARCVNPDDVLRDLLQQAICSAEAYAQKKGIANELSEIRNIVKDIGKPS